MKDKIIDRLTEFEKERNINILYACESGSRAWGFPSTDSDYDVRFFYTHQPNWYMSIDDRKDTIEEVGEVLDFNGWEVRKSLRLFRSTNSSLYEKLQSPIVYIEKGDFRKGMVELMPDFYEPISGIYHYLSLVRNFYDDQLSGESVKLKKYFYAIRSVLAAKWIREEGGVPPIEFAKLRTLEKDNGWNEIIDRWLALKFAATESFTVEKSDFMNRFIVTEMELGNSYAQALKKRKKPDSEILNTFFRNWVG